MYVGNSQGTEYYQVSVKLYDLNYNLIYSGTSAGTGLGSPFGGYTPNVVADMTDGGNDTPNPTLGRVVAVLVNKEQPSGSYTVPFNASKLSSGIYLYTINAKGFNKVKKMLLLK